MQWGAGAIGPEGACEGRGMRWPTVVTQSTTRTCHVSPGSGRRTCPLPPEASVFLLGSRGKCRAVAYLGWHVKLAFDVGMYDGADTDYLLRSGFRVVAIEAHPLLCERAQARFAREIAEGRLTVANVAIAADEGTIGLSLCGDDLGSSSIVADKLRGTRHAGTLTVPATTIASLFAAHGVPDYMKIDIEGADRHCILPLTMRTAPRQLSFEVDEDVLELVAHLADIGYGKFKLIGQTSFLEMDAEYGFGYRFRNRVMKLLGYDEPGLVRRNGMWFPLMHSSGPGPWESDGDWYSADTLLRKWKRSGDLARRQGWYDVHAMR